MSPLEENGDNERKALVSCLVYYLVFWEKRAGGIKSIFIGG